MDKFDLLQGVDDDWLEILDNPLLDTVLKELSDCEHITPAPDKIFEFARLTGWDGIKVVILGQDPYHTPGNAHGLAFSCMDGVPKSLKNIYKCLIAHDLIPEMPTTGNLTRWANQGVLLINTALTTIEGTANAHAAIWREYTRGIIAEVSKKNPIFLLWGEPAAKMEKYITSEHILKYAHPSPIQTKYPFVDCNHFTEVNRILKENKQDPIDWKVVEADDIEISFGMHAHKQVVFTDGSANPNKTSPDCIGAYAAAFALGTFKNTTLYGNIENRPHYANNQRAEGYTFLKVFEFLKEHLSEWTECLIITDSKFWIGMIEQHMPNWDKYGTPFEEKKNSDLTTKIYALYTELVNMHGKEIYLRHVHSHDKDGWSKYKKNTYEYFCYVWNDYVDLLAKHARKNLKPGEHKQGEVEFD